MLNLFIWISFPTCLCAVCAFAWWQGSAAERYGSLSIFTANALADLLLFLLYPTYPSVFMCGVDLALSIALLVIALKYSSLWLGVAMLLQSIALGLHALDLGQDGPSNAMQYVLNDVLSYAMLVCIVGGTIASRLSRARLKGHAAPLATLEPC